MEFIQTAASGCELRHGRLKLYRNSAKRVGGRSRCCVQAAQLCPDTDQLIEAASYYPPLRVLFIYHITAFPMEASSRRDLGQS
jgi:hypothetical protein